MGQTTFRSLLKDSYFFGAAGALAVCDYIREETLESLDEWVKSLFQTAGEVPILILANKNDPKEERKIEEGGLKDKASMYHTNYMYTSARTGENVERPFNELGRLILP